MAGVPCRSPLRTRGRASPLPFRRFDGSVDPVVSCWPGWFACSCCIAFSLSASGVAVLCRAGCITIVWPCFVSRSDLWLALVFDHASLWRGTDVAVASVPVFRALGWCVDHISVRSIAMEHIQKRSALFYLYSHCAFICVPLIRYPALQLSATRSLLCGAHRT